MRLMLSTNPVLSEEMLKCIYGSQFTNKSVDLDVKLETRLWISLSRIQQSLIICCVIVLADVYFTCHKMNSI